MRKHLSKWHRRIGIFAALIAIHLSITGLMLNHSHDLGLDTARLENPLLLRLYGIKPPSGNSVRVADHRVSRLGRTLFLDDQLIGQYDSALTGAAELGQQIVIAMTDSLLLLSPQGELIDMQTVNSGLPGQIDHLATVNGKVLIESGQQIYRGDEELLDWLQLENMTSRPDWSAPGTLPAVTADRLRPLLPAYGPSWERILQDLHSGRFFKLPGTLLIDLTGITLLLLSISGIVSFTLRKKAIRKKAIRL